MTQEEFHKRFQYNLNSDCLGEGGFGKVYKAYDIHLDRFVALKIAVVKQNYEEVRLKKEVELINKLPTHPNIAHYEECYSFSTYTGEYDYGVLQYYEQGNLQQLLDVEQLTYEQKDSILKQILEGIGFLHTQGIIHRDLKPSNILIALNQKGQYVPKIIDFGISKKLDINISSVFTNSLVGAGTLYFASPEQLTGQTIRKNTDLWSFGVIVCWMFTGKLPFNSGSQVITSEAGRIELFKQIISGEITSIFQQLPIVWQNLIKLCIVVDVEKRITSAGKCLEMLSINAVTNTKNEIQKAINQTLQAANNKTIIYIVESKIQLSTVLIPAGTFTMGSPLTEVSRDKDETQHQVTLSAFRMSKYTITNAQYAAFLNTKSIGCNGLYAAGAYPAQVLIYTSSGNNDSGLHYRGMKWIPVSGYENNPVINVTWYGATEFATYMGGTLPTEAQWEYACRGCTTTRFSTGNLLTNQQANYGGMNTATTYSEKVGTYSPNAYGLYDMHGNVWEWCANWWYDYPTIVQTNPTGAALGSSRMVRGGSFCSSAQFCRSACRSCFVPSYFDDAIGFRLVFVP